MGLFDKIAGKSDKPLTAEEEAARQLEATRRETAQRLSGSRAEARPPTRPPMSLGARPPEAPMTPEAGREPPRPATPPTPPAGFSPPAANPFASAASASAATPQDERRSITDMALQDLERQRQAAPGDSPYVRAARLPEDELERRRPPAPGETLPGVPPPHIPSEDLRDQALREILERKERLDREYRDRMAARGEGGGQTRSAQAPAGPKTRLHGLARKKLSRPAPAGERTPAPEQPPSPAVARQQPAAPKPRPALKKRVEPAAVTPPPAPAPAAASEESVTEALSGVKGVGPVILGGLLERFDSVEEIREADPEELTAVAGIGPALAARIQSSL